jgi:hypothetical protein
VQKYHAFLCHRCKNPPFSGFFVETLVELRLIITNFRVTERRVIVSRGDFIQHKGGMAQVKEICIHEHTSLEPPGRRLFAYCQPIRLTGERDFVLDLPLVEPYGSLMLLGLPSILGKKLYIVDVSDVDEELVLVDWSIQFL